MLGRKRWFALAAWVGLLALTFSPASIAVTVNGGNLVCSDDNWCWRMPLPQGNNLRTFWGSGESDIWGVGDVGTILHWDGSAWTSVSSGTANWRYRRACSIRANLIAVSTRNHAADCDFSLPKRPRVAPT